MSSYKTKNFSERVKTKKIPKVFDVMSSSGKKRPSANNIINSFVMKHEYACLS